MTASFSHKQIHLTLSLRLFALLTHWNTNLYMKNLSPFWIDKIWYWHHRCGMKHWMNDKLNSWKNINWSDIITFGQKSKVFVHRRLCVDLQTKSCLPIPILITVVLGYTSFGMLKISPILITSFHQPKYHSIDDISSRGKSTLIDNSNINAFLWLLYRQKERLDKRTVIVLEIRLNWTFFSVYRAHSCSRCASIDLIEVASPHTHLLNLIDNRTRFWTLCWLEMRDEGRKQLHKYENMIIAILSSIAYIYSHQLIGLSFSFYFLIDFPLGRFDQYECVMKTLCCISHLSYVFSSNANSGSGKLSPRMVFAQASMMLVQSLSLSPSLKEVRVCLCVRTAYII